MKNTLMAAVIALTSTAFALPNSAYASGRNTAAALIFGAAVGAMAASAAAQAQPRQRVQQRAKARPKARAVKPQNRNVRTARDPFASVPQTVPAKFR